MTLHRPHIVDRPAALTARANGPSRRLSMEIAVLLAVHRIEEELHVLVGAEFEAHHGVVTIAVAFLEHRAAANHFLAMFDEVCDRALQRQYTRLLAIHQREHIHAERDCLAAARRTSTTTRPA